MCTSWWSTTHRPLRIWFFDVGQGDSTLVQFPSGENVLVDAGTNLPSMGKMVVVPQLKALGVNALDYVVATHPDSDHTGGIPDVLRQEKVNYFVEPDEDGGSDEIMQEIHGLCTAKAITEFQPSDGDLEKLSDKCSLSVLNPPREANARLPLKDNNRAVVLKINYGDFSAMLMADAEAPVEQRLLGEGITHCNILKVGHHGSKTSSTPQFLNTVHPDYAVISCGLNNRFGHPNKDVLTRIQQTGARICRTDMDGAILVESDGTGYTIKSAGTQNDE